MSQKNISVRNTVLAIIIVAIVSVASTYSFSASMIPPTTVTVQQTAASPLKMCGSMHLSGRMAGDGTLVRDAYMLWADYINSQGGLLGRQIIIIIYDDGSDADRAVANLERCVTVDHADLLLGTNGSVIVYPILVVSEKYKMVYISPAGGAPRIFADRQPKYYFYSAPATADLQIRSQFQFFDTLPEAQRPTNVALNCGNDVFSEGLHDRAVEYSASRNIKVVFDQPYVLGQPDYTSDVLAVKATDPDFLFVCGGADIDTANYVKAIGQVQFKAKYGIWIPNGPVNPEWVKEMGGLADGLFGPVGWSPYTKSFQNDLFQQLWKQKYGTDAPGAGGEAWSCMQVLEAAIRGTNSFDNEVLAQYIHANSFKSIYGPDEKFDELGRPQGDFALGQLQKGVIQIVFPADVATASAIWPAGGTGSPSLSPAAISSVTKLETVQ